MKYWLKKGLIGFVIGLITFIIFYSLLAILKFEATSLGNILFMLIFSPGMFSELFNLSTFFGTIISIIFSYGLPVIGAIIGVLIGKKQSQ